MVADLRDSILKIVDENEDGKLSVNELARLVIYTLINTLTPTHLQTHTHD